MKIEDALDEFIRDKQPRTLILQGSWGRGKTHLWNSRWDLYADQQGRACLPARRYAYVSLFGLNSISEATVAIGLASLENDPPPAAPGTSRRSGRIRTWFAKGTRLANDLPAELPYVGFGTKQIAQVFAHSRAKELLVCLDDIERRGKDLSIRDVQGLISSLSIQRKCSVVAILNDGSLGEDQSEWDAHREKVFQRHLTYAPSAIECIALIFPEDDMRPIAKYLRDALVELDLTNIRVAERVHGFVDDIFEVLGDRALQPPTLGKIARSISILTYCHMAQGEGAPSLKFARSHGAFSSYMQERREGVSQQQLDWGRLLDNFGAFLDDPIDKVFEGLVLNGYIEQAPLLAAVDGLEAGAADEGVKEAYSAAWNVWRNNFRSNQAEVIEAFTTHFPPAASSMSANNADSAFQLLRSFGANAEADALMDEWMRYRVGDRARELHPDYLNQMERLKDPVFIGRTSEAFHGFGESLPPFGDAILTLGLRQGHNEEDIAAIATASVEDIQAYLLANEGRGLVMGVKACIDLGEHNETYREAKARVVESVLRLADRSAFDKDKIKRIYGIERASD